MHKVIMIGCDLHDATTVLRWADGPGESVRLTFATSECGKMIAGLKQLAGQRGVGARESIPPVGRTGLANLSGIISSIGRGT